MEGLVRYTAAEASLAADGLRGLAQVEWLDRVRQDLESYRAALAWLIDHNRAAEASDIAWSLFFFWAIRGHAAEGIQWYEQILNQPTLSPAVESRALLGTAAMRYTQGELGHARRALTRALALAQEAGDIMMIARAENLLGDIEHSVGNADAAREHFARGIEKFRALAIPWGLGNSLTGMAGVVLATGDPAQAERLLDEATSVLRQAAPWFLSWTLYLRAFLAVHLGNPDEAIAFVRESLTHIRQLHDTYAFVYALVPLPPQQCSKGTTSGRPEFWAPGTPSRSALAPLLPRNRSTTSKNRRSERCERASAPSLGAGILRRRTTSIDALLKDIDNILRKRPPAD